jgi:hypothetical protein
MPSGRSRGKARTRTMKEPENLSTTNARWAGLAIEHQAQRVKSVAHFLLGCHFVSATPKPQTETGRAAYEAHLDGAGLVLNSVAEILESLARDVFGPYTRGISKLKTAKRPRS